MAVVCVRPVRHAILKDDLGALHWPGFDSSEWHAKVATNGDISYPRDYVALGALMKVCFHTFWGYEFVVSLSGTDVKSLQCQWGLVIAGMLR